jgi:hypothetical protein
MIAIGESRQCSAVEAYFARLIACEGFKATRAYRIAWKSKANDAHAIASRVMARPHVQAKIAELREQADREAVMSLVERRKLLADTARRPVKEAPSHGERIAAIREDSILAGERGTDGTHLNLSLGVSIGAVLGALRSASADAIPVQAIPVDVPRGTIEADPAPATLQPAPRAVPAPTAAILGDPSPSEGKDSGSMQMAAKWAPRGPLGAMGAMAVAAAPLESDE